MSQLDAFMAQIDQLLDDPERTDPARLARADQAVQRVKEHWSGIVQATRPMLENGYGHTAVVDLVVTAAAQIGLAPEDLAALLGVAAIRSWEQARRRTCGVQAADPRGSFVCVLPNHVGDRHVGMDSDGEIIRFGYFPPRGPS